MYYPIRPLRSVVKESAKSELRSVSTELPMPRRTNGSKSE